MREDINLQMYKRPVHARRNMLSLEKKNRMRSSKFKLQGGLCPEAEESINKASEDESLCRYL